MPALPFPLDLAEDVAEDGAAARGLLLLLLLAFLASRGLFTRSGCLRGGGTSVASRAVARAWPLFFFSSCLFVLVFFLLFLDGREAQLGPPREVGKVEAEVVLSFFGFFFFLVESGGVLRRGRKESAAGGFLANQLIPLSLYSLLRLTVSV